MKEYIERETLLELYANTENYNIDNYHVPIQVIRQNIIDMPAADVKEVIHAKWINRIGSYLTPKCSNCGWSEPYSEDSCLGVLNYCPNCGAKMDSK